MSDGLEAPPDGMDVEVGHAGVVWSIGARPGALAIALALLGSGATAIGWGVASGSWGGLVGIVGLGLGAMVVPQAMRSTRVRIDDRAITVEHRSPTGAETSRLLLDEVDAVGVRRGSGSRDACLVLDTREGPVLLGAGRPEVELHWVARAIHAAQDAFGRRERAEGREWTFLRKVPKDLERLRS